MNIENFKEWCNKAYPDVVFDVVNNSMIRARKKNSSTGVLCSRGVYRFPESPNFNYQTTITSDDSEIISGCRVIWGEPKIAYSIPQEQSEQPRKEVRERKTKPEEKKVSQVDLVDKKAKVMKTLRSDKANILGNLKSEYGDLLVFNKLVSGAIEIKTKDGKLGPILYNYGISPSSEKTHIFIPYSHEKKVTSLIEGWINSINLK